MLLVFVIGCIERNSRRSHSFAFGMALSLCIFSQKGVPCSVARYGSKKGRSKSSAMCGDERGESDNNEESRTTLILKGRGRRLFHFTL